jgi:hypothetical protein
MVGPALVMLARRPVNVVRLWCWLGQLYPASPARFTVAAEPVSITDNDSSAPMLFRFFVVAPPPSDSIAYRHFIASFSRYVLYT